MPDFDLLNRLRADLNQAEKELLQPPTPAESAPVAAEPAVEPVAAEPERPIHYCASGHKCRCDFGGGHGGHACGWDQASEDLEADPQPEGDSHA